MNRDEKAEMTARLVAAGFRHAPGPLDSLGYGEATLVDPDGVYFNIVSDDGKDNQPHDVQLIIVGRMDRTPTEFAAVVGPRYRVLDCKFLLPAGGLPESRRQLVLSRGFISLHFRRSEDDRREAAA
jgi:hypothetical protein